MSYYSFFSQVQDITQPVAVCDDFSYSFGNGKYRITDHSEGETIVLSYEQIVESVAYALTSDDDIDTDTRFLASNVVAYAHPTVLAKFMINLFP